MRYQYDPFSNAELAELRRLFQSIDKTSRPGSRSHYNTTLIADYLQTNVITYLGRLLATLEASQAKNPSSTSDVG